MATAQVVGVLHYVSKTPSQRQTGCTLYTLVNGRTFSCQPDGSGGDRDPGADGVYEQGQESGSLATFNPSGTLYTWLLAPVDKLAR